MNPRNSVLAQKILFLKSIFSISFSINQKYITDYKLSDNKSVKEAFDDLIKRNNNPIEKNKNIETLIEDAEKLTVKILSISTTPLATQLKSHLHYQDLQKEHKALTSYLTIINNEFESKPKSQENHEKEFLKLYKSFVDKISYLLKKSVDQGNFLRTSALPMQQKIEEIEKWIRDDKETKMDEKTMAAAIKKLRESDSESIELAYKAGLKATPERVPTVFEDKLQEELRIKKLNPATLAALKQLNNDLFDADENKDYKNSVDSLKKLPDHIRLNLHRYPSIIDDGVLKHAMEKSADFRMARSYGNNPKRFASESELLKKLDSKALAALKNFGTELTLGCESKNFTKAVKALEECSDIVKENLHRFPDIIKPKDLHQGMVACAALRKIHSVSGTDLLKSSMFTKNKSGTETKTVPAASVTRQNKK